MGGEIGLEHYGDPLPALLQGEGVIGVSRLHSDSAFSGPTMCTLVYSADAVRIEVMDARRFSGSPFRGTITQPLRALRHFGPLESWERLRAAAFAAPSCSTVTRDGGGYRHALLDWQGGIEARWRNPSWQFHRQQWELAHAYWELVESSGLLLERGRRVRIRVGVLSGFTGTVEYLDPDKGRLRVVADLGGQRVSVDLGLSDIECAGTATDPRSELAG